MTDEQEQPTKSRFITHLSTAITSLVVGVALTWFGFYLSQKEPALIYDVIDSSPFAGETEKIAILAIRVRNVGTREAEDVFFKIEIENGNVRDTRVSGIASSLYSTESDDKSLIVKAPFLNDGEQFIAQLLVGLDREEKPVHEVQVRGKGTIGKRELETKGGSPMIGRVITASIFGLMGMAMIIRFMPGILDFLLEVELRRQERRKRDKDISTEK